MTRLRLRICAVIAASSFALVAALQAQKQCRVVNPVTGRAPGFGALVTSWFAFPLQTRGVMSVTALDFHLSTNARFRKDANGRVGIWTSVGGRPGRLLGSAPFVASRWVPGWYGAKFGFPISLAASTQYFVAFRNLDALTPSLASTGTTTPYYWGPPAFRAWQGPKRGLRFSYRVYCGTHSGSFTSYGSGKAGSGGAVPRLRGLGQPNTTNTMHLQLSRAAAQRPALLLLGSRVTIPLPPGTLYATPTAVLSAVTRGTNAGTGHWTVDLPIPNDARLRGALLGTQVWVLDAGARASLAHTQGLQIRIGH